MATIAQQRHDAASAKFEKKLQELQKLIEDGPLERFPKLVSIASFAEWENSELGTKKIARSTIYGKDNHSVAKRQRLNELLRRMAALRSKSKKKENAETTLRQAKANADMRANVYLNQYSMAKAELDDALADIARLNRRLAEFTANKRKIVPLLVAKNGISNEE